MSQISVVAVIKAKPESREALLPLLEVLEETTSNEEDANVYYRIHEDLDSPDTFVCMEIWESKDALDQHMETPHFKEFLKASEELVESVTVQILKPLF